MSTLKVWALAALLALATMPAQAAAPEFAFGDDAGQYSKDGECDDPRFEGPGMTTTALLNDDVLHDATDCQAAFDAGKLTLRGVAADGAIDSAMTRANMPRTASAMTCASSARA